MLLVSSCLALWPATASPAGLPGSAQESVAEEARATQESPADGWRATLVRQLVAAFNAHDPQAMGALTADGIQWLSIAGSSLATEAEGRAALIEGMTSYFADFPTVRSEIEELAVMGDYVVVRERVTWNSATGRRSQASMAVWEIADDKIVRVWYYPAEREGEG